MLSLLSKLLGPLVDPPNLMALLLVCGAILLWTRWIRLGRALVTIAALFFLCAGLLPMGRWLLVMLERDFPPANPPAHVDGIIALGGGVDARLSDRYGRAVLNDAAERLVALAELHRRFPNAVAIYAGGVQSFSALSENEGAARALAQMGADPSGILFERRSRNTWENALFARDLVKPTPGQVWLLVTSAYHMPRATAVFRALNWSVLPYPVGQRTTGRFDFYPGIDVPKQLLATSLAAHEAIGLFAYWLFGWTQEVFGDDRSKSVESP